MDITGSLATLSNLQPDDPPPALAVEAQRFASDGVTPHMLHRLVTNLLTVSAIVGLFNAGVNCGDDEEERFKARGT